jgi:hypothetical protein
MSSPSAASPPVATAGNRQDSHISFAATPAWGVSEQWIEQHDPTKEITE